MSLYDLLIAKEDSRKGNEGSCKFNGYLEDHLLDLEDSNVKDILSKLFELDNNIRIIVDLNIAVSKDSISNAIIRYKDIYKNEDKALCIPYIVYFKKEDDSKAIIIIDDDYLYAKGLYYALTEPGSGLREYYNDVLAVDTSNSQDIIDAFKDIFDKRVGQIQRSLDAKRFSGYDEAFERAKSLCETFKEDIYEKIEKADDKETFIRSCVARFYLLKKFVYVQYMTDKNILSERHEGNIKSQRNRAKNNADAIRFISISELWRGKENQEIEEID